MAQVSSAQRDFHIATETASVLFVAPVLWTIGGQQKTQRARRLLRGIAVASVIIDGALLLRWAYVKDR